MKTMIGVVLLAIASVAVGVQAGRVMTKRLDAPAKSDKPFPSLGCYGSGPYGTECPDNATVEALRSTAPKWESHPEYIYPDELLYVRNGAVRWSAFTGQAWCGVGSFTTLNAAKECVEGGTRR